MSTTCSHATAATSQMSFFEEARSGRFSLWLGTCSSTLEFFGNVQAVVGPGLAVATAFGHRSVAGRRSREVSGWPRAGKGRAPGAPLQRKGGEVCVSTATGGGTTALSVLVARIAVAEADAVCFAHPL